MPGGKDKDIDFAKGIESLPGQLLHVFGARGVGTMHGDWVLLRCQLCFKGLQAVVASRCGHYLAPCAGQQHRCCATDAARSADYDDHLIL